MSRESILKTELAAGHPGTGRYDDDHKIAHGQLHAVNRTRTVRTLTGAVLFSLTDDGEFGALPDVAKTLWLDLCKMESVDIQSGIGKSIESSLFGAGTSTRSAIVATRTESISRAVELSIPGTKVGHIEEARR